MKALHRAPARILALLVVVLGPVALPAQDGGTLVYPPNNEGTRTLEDRRQFQLNTKGNFAVFVDFGFEDRFPDSGITFVNESVQDSCETIRLSSSLRTTRLVSYAPM